MKTDTIAAIATALSDSGIGIIRVSGEDSISVVDSVFRTKGGKRILQRVESHTIHYGYIVNGSGEILDEVMVSVMKKPRSYTAEDTVEINCHGGLLIMRKVLEEVLRSGARMAEPGEFTKRAFLNGRIDLSRAEAVMDVIHSQNEYALAASVSQLNGRLAKEVRELRGEILYETAFIESALDDPEHISLDGYAEKLLDKVNGLLSRIKRLTDTAENGRWIKEGIATVIIGKPNVGKSSLLNLLVGEEKAIVTDVAGTTRDILEEYINLHGISLRVIDTAGIRNTEDVVEKIGVEKARMYASSADLIVYVVDASLPLDESDREIVSLIGNRRMIVLLNKSDLKSAVSEEEIQSFLRENIPPYSSFKIIKTSMTDGAGMEEFENMVREMFFEGDISYNGELVITNMRHREALQSAYESLELVKKSIEDGMEEDFYSIDLMDAYKELGKIVGEEVEEDLVEEIFSRFCMGK